MWKTSNLKAILWKCMFVCHFILGVLAKDRAVIADVSSFWVYKIKKRIRFLQASICLHVWLPACVISASYVSWSPDQAMLYMMPKNRVSVIGSVNSSALLNYSRSEKKKKGWWLPFCLHPPSLSAYGVFSVRDVPHWCKRLRHRGVCVTVSYARLWISVIF